MMPAIRFHRHGAPEVLQLEQVPVPEPGPGELLVRVEGAGVTVSRTDRNEMRGSGRPDWSA